VADAEVDEVRGEGRFLRWLFGGLGGFFFLLFLLTLVVRRVFGSCGFGLGGGVLLWF